MERDAHLHLGVVLCPAVRHQRHQRLRRGFARRHVRTTVAGRRLLVRVRVGVRVRVRVRVGVGVGVGLQRHQRG